MIESAVDILIVLETLNFILSLYGERIGLDSKSIKSFRISLFRCDSSLTRPIPGRYTTSFYFSEFTTPCVFRLTFSFKSLSLADILKNYETKYFYFTMSSY
jgi:hypothetical protein